MFSSITKAKAQFAAFFGAVFLGLAASPVSAVPVIDQLNPIVGTTTEFCYIHRFGQDNLCGQSFVQTSNNIAGAGIFVDPDYSTGIGNLTISIFSNYSSTPSGLVASGTATGVSSNSGWIDVFWSAAGLIPGATYYMVLSATIDLVTLASPNSNNYAAGSILNIGILNDPGYYPGWDLAFRTYSDSEFSSNVSAPGALALFGLGLIGLVGSRRKRVIA